MFLALLGSSHDTRVTSWDASRVGSSGLSLGFFLIALQLLDLLLHDFLEAFFFFLFFLLSSIGQGSLLEALFEGRANVKALAATDSIW